LPIGKGQTISQPWVVARMTEALIEHCLPKKVLEIGTGSGYQGSVLATLGMEVFTVERIEELLRQARRRFRNLNFNVRSKHVDGHGGSSVQKLLRLRKTPEGIVQDDLGNVVFVPLVSGII
jgi:protein-L-isoaspartate(D-aspartate) O-methyltransferase